MSFLLKIQTFFRSYVCTMGKMKNCRNFVLTTHLVFIRENTSPFFNLKSDILRNSVHIKRKYYVTNVCKIFLFYKQRLSIVISFFYSFLETPITFLDTQLRPPCVSRKNDSSKDTFCGWANFTRKMPKNEMSK